MADRAKTATTMPTNGSYATLETREAMASGGKFSGEHDSRGAVHMTDEASDATARTRRKNVKRDEIGRPQGSAKVGLAVAVSASIGGSGLPAARGSGLPAARYYGPTGQSSGLISGEIQPC